MSQKPTQRNNKRSVAHKQPHLTQNNLGLEHHEGLALAIAAIPTAAIIKAFTIKK